MVMEISLTPTTGQANHDREVSRSKRQYVDLMTSSSNLYEFEHDSNDEFSLEIDEG
jgi:hypothetical protein